MHICVLAQSESKFLESLCMKRQCEALMEASEKRLAQTIKLNVGGVLFETAPQELCLRSTGHSHLPTRVEALLTKKNIALDSGSVALFRFAFGWSHWVEIGLQWLLLRRSFTGLCVTASPGHQVERRLRPRLGRARKG